MGPYSLHQVGTTASTIGVCNGFGCRQGKSTPHQILISGVWHQKKVQYICDRCATTNISSAEVSERWRIASISPLSKVWAEKELGKFKPSNLMAVTGKAMKKILWGGGRLVVLLDDKNHHIINHNELMNKSNCQFNLIQFSDWCTGELDVGVTGRHGLPGLQQGYCLHPIKEDDRKTGMDGERLTMEIDWWMFEWKDKDGWGESGNVRNKENDYLCILHWLDLGPVQCVCLNHTWGNTFLMMTHWEVQQNRMGGKSLRKVLKKMTKSEES